MKDLGTWSDRLGQVLLANAQGLSDWEAADLELASLQAELEVDPEERWAWALMDVLGFRIDLLIDAAAWDRARPLIERRVALTEIAVQSAAGGAVVSLISLARLHLAEGEREKAREVVARLLRQHGWYVDMYASPELGEVIAGLCLRPSL